MTYLLDQRLWRFLFCLLFAMVLYLTVKPRPQISEEPWIPSGASRFFDLHDDWKNVTGFGALAFCGFLGWTSGWGPGHWPVRRRRLVQAEICCAVAVVMELLQLFIPTRHCDWKDMIWGSLGVGLALFPARFLRSRFAREAHTASSPPP